MSPGRAPCRHITPNSHIHMRIPAQLARFPRRRHPLHRQRPQARTPRQRRRCPLRYVCLHYFSRGNVPHSRPPRHTRAHVPRITTRPPTHSNIRAHPRKAQRLPLRSAPHAGRRPCPRPTRRSRQRRKSRRLGPGVPRPSRPPSPLLCRRSSPRWTLPTSAPTRPH